MASNPSSFLLSLRGLVPAISHNGTNVCESLVAVEYINEAFDTGINLLPSSPAERSVSVLGSYEVEVVEGVSILFNVLYSSRAISLFLPVIDLGLGGNAALISAVTLQHARLWTAHANERIIPHFYKLLMHTTAAERDMDKVWPMGRTFTSVSHADVDILTFTSACPVGQPSQGLATVR